jgi:hypothetical protein
MTKKSLLLFALFITAVCSIYARPSVLEDPFPVEEELEHFVPDNRYDERFLENTEISLLTVERGSEIFSWFGHTAIIISNPEIEDRIFDAGVFSYTDTFVQDLLSGRLFFGSYQSYAKYSLERFDADGRSYTKIPLILTNSEKNEIISFLSYHARSENRIYLYDYYFDNCATRPRDIIDHAIGGKLKEYGAVGEGTTFRKLTAEKMSGCFPVNFTFNFLEGPAIDRPATRYEAAFIPDRLESLIEDFESGKGAESHDYPLFGSTFRLTLESLALSLIFSAFLLTLLEGKKNWTKRIAAFILFLLFLYLGVLASVLLYMQNFSFHTVTYGNENLAIISPLFLILAVGYAVKLFKPAKRLKFTLFIARLQLFLASLLLLGKGLFPDIFQQDNFYVFTLAVPLLLAVVRNGKTPKESY